MIFRPHQVVLKDQKSLHGLHAVRVDGLVPAHIRRLHQVLLLGHLETSLLERIQHLVRVPRRGQTVSDENLLANLAVLLVLRVVLVRQAPLVRREDAAGFKTRKISE